MGDEDLVDGESRSGGQKRESCEKRGKQARLDIKFPWGLRRIGAPPA